MTGDHNSYTSGPTIYQPYNFPHLQFPVLQYPLPPVKYELFSEELRAEIEELRKFEEFAEKLRERIMAGCFLPDDVLDIIPPPRQPK